MLVKHIKNKFGKQTAVNLGTRLRPYVIEAHLYAYPFLESHPMYHYFLYPLFKRVKLRHQVLGHHPFYATTIALKTVGDDLWYLLFVAFYRFVISFRLVTCNIILYTLGISKQNPRWNGTEKGGTDVPILPECKSASRPPAQCTSTPAARRVRHVLQTWRARRVLQTKGKANSSSDS